MWARFESRLVPAPFRFPMAERRSIGRWTRLTREFQLSCSPAGAPISRRKLPQQQQQGSQQNIRSFQHDPVCLHAPIILIKRNKQVLGSRFWNRFLDQTVPVPEYSSQPYNFPLFWHEASPGWWQQTVKRRIWLNHSKGHCHGQKGHVWLIFTHFSVLISSIEVLPKCIASCSFSEVILVLFSNFNGVGWF